MTPFSTTPPSRKRLSTQPAGSTDEFPPVEARVLHSTEIWARDLQALYHHVKERFGDVIWETDDGSEAVWGHKGASGLRDGAESSCDICSSAEYVAATLHPLTEINRISLALKSRW